MFLTSMSSTRSPVISNDFDEYVTSLPMDEIIAQQLASLVDASQTSLQNLASSFLAPFSSDLLNRLTIIMLLVERAVFPSSLSREASRSRLLIIPLRSDDNTDSTSDQLLFCVVIFCVGISELYRPITNNYRYIFETRGRRHWPATESLFLAGNLILCILSLGSLLPMAIWSVGCFSLSRRIYGDTTTVLVPLFVWLNYWTLVLISKAVRQ